MLSSLLRGAALLLPLALALPARGQDRPDVAVYGFVRAETFFDSHRVDEGGGPDVAEQYGLYPVPEGDGFDRQELGFSAQQSRIGVRAAGAYAFGADVSGAVEADFFSPVSGATTFRLRNAFIKLDWGTHEVLAGHYWSPLFNVSVFPGTVAFNTGAPFQPFARQPQLRAVWTPGPARITAVLAGQQGEFSDLDSRGLPDARLVRRASLPLAHLHAQLAFGESLVGAGVYGKTVRPVLGQDRFYAGAVQAYGKLSTYGLTISAKATYGSDLADHLMTGGYVALSTPEGLDYHPLRVVSGWLDVGTRGHPVTFGLFGGVLTNIGTNDDLPTAPALVGARAPDLHLLWRVAPRASYNSGPARIAAEVEVSSAQWAEGFGVAFEPAGDTEGVTNVRGLLAFYYFF